ncbi:MAG TPA: S8 family serine peptidase [Miltoncostaeaceae bacterium]|nr:S8 family serine peptidase [Miltoncostaeaceae bacterium]
MRLVVITAALLGLAAAVAVGPALGAVAHGAPARPTAAVPAQPEPVGYGDAIIGQGLDRTGAAALVDTSDGGAGVRIAVLDMGFGADWRNRQALGELPANRQLVLRSFDASAGLAGTNAYTNPTDHGDLVGQTVYDYAPKASYWFVNYHTVDDFVAAVDWLISQRVDIVVHSNNFLDGPFDGTSPAARAVDRAAAAGILWFNSAGNYAQKHWSGPWTDATGDRVLDWPVTPDWEMVHDSGRPFTFHLSWDNPPGAPPSDLDLQLQRLDSGGVWSTVASSTARQTDAGPASERINGWRPAATGTYRLRVLLAAGPPPAGPLTLFSREDDLSPIGGTAAGSVPTPADADGSISIGATEWRGNVLKSYSSQGPTADGRMKPDLAAPTGTALAASDGPKEVGGTSNAAPNAAGAAAVVLSSERAAGLSPTAADIRAQLVQSALDLGTPGPDMAFGFGRVKVDDDPPSVDPVSPVPLQAVHRSVRLRIGVSDASRVAEWSVAVDGQRLSGALNDQAVVGGILDTRRLADGLHVVQVNARDWPGNIATRVYGLVVDNTRPTLAVRRVTLGRRHGPVRPRAVTIALKATDAVASRLRLRVALVALSGRTVASRELKVRSGRAVEVAAGRLTRGVWRVDVSVADAAGNERFVRRRLVVR